MRIALITRATLYTARGGDTVQVTETARHLEQLGIMADIRLTHERIDYSLYDLLHFFNVIRPADILCHIRRSRKPFVVSTISVDYTEYDTQQRDGFMGALMRVIPEGHTEYVKTILRFLTGRDRLMTWSYLWKGQRRSVEEILDKACFVLPNSEMEEHALRQAYQCLSGFVTVHNGVDPQLFKYSPGIAKDPLLVLCVARIEGLKNQLNLIKALNNTIYKVVIIGAPAPGQLAYYRQCRKAAEPNITFIDHLPQPQLVEYYQKAGVHVLPSWFETCGLSSLEAGVMGCNIVVTGKGYTREYYEDYAWYCEPSSPQSIFDAVERAAKAAFPAELREKILACYTWIQAASAIVKAYHYIPVIV